MGKELICNVILWHDGSIHIAMNNRKVVQCTNTSLPALFSNPVSFVNSAVDNYRSTTSIVNTKYEELEKIPGVVLASAYSDKEITIFYPELLKKLFDKYNQLSNTPLAFDDLAAKENILDEKEYFLKFFLSVSQLPEFMTKIKSPLDLDPQYMSQCFQEVFIALMQSKDNKKSTFIARENNNQADSLEIDGSLRQIKDDPDKIEWVTCEEYSTIRLVPQGTVSCWASGRRFLNQKKVKGRWYVNLYETPVDRRKGKKHQADEITGAKKVRLKGTSEKEVQDYLLGRHLWSPEVSKFIRSKAESDYFEHNKYKECEIAGKPALIIDICPDFINPLTGKSNSKVIKEDGSPVVPFKENEPSLFDQENSSFAEPTRYHLHHIGQRADSPIAIIPERDHNSKEWYSVFHPHAASDENLHTKEFEQIERPNFWKSYLRLYEQFGGYRQIPKRDPRQKQKNKKIDKANEEITESKEAV